MSEACGADLLQCSLLNEGSGAIPVGCGHLVAFLGWKLSPEERVQIFKLLLRDSGPWRGSKQVFAQPGNIDFEVRLHGLGPLLVDDVRQRLARALGLWL